jgi:plasmid stability protein
MPPLELKIRNLDDVTIRRLKTRADEAGISVEALLRALVTDALADDVTAADWADAGFDQVDEIVPGRLYEVWADAICYRIAITRPVVQSSKIRWGSSIDQLLSPDFGSGRDAHHLWIRPFGIPQRLIGDTPELALRDAMHWLANWARVDEIGWAQRDAEGAERMEPGLRTIADQIDDLFGPNAIRTWRDERRARWSTEKYDFFVSRSGGEVVLMTYPTGSQLLAYSPVSFLMVTDVARKIVEQMFLHLEGHGEPLPRQRKQR